MTSALSGLNFRDVGGLPTRGGRRVREGVLFRSEGPKNFADAHVAELRARGIRAIFDLRSADERGHDPHCWQDAGCALLTLDMNTDLRAADSIEWDRLRDDPDPALGGRILRQNYRAMPAALLPHWQPLVGALLDGRRPAIINCTAGKDRTGVAVALLLELLDVPREAIVQDYLRSDVFGGNMRMRGSIEQGFMDSFGFVPRREAIDALIGVDPGYLESALDEVERRWNGVNGYFDAAGVPPATRGTLVQLMTTDG